MQVFEFHFNPKLKPDLIFDSFCYEPENIYEKRMGSLYLVGALKNVLPQDFSFLDNLAKVIKKGYYRLTLKNPEKALKESLEEANEFLEQKAKAGNVKWLGNLSFGVLSLKNYELNFTKVGDLKIFLLREGKVIDIDQKLKGGVKEITPWPLRIFENIISGKLAEDDILLVLTKEVTDFFERGNLLTEIAKIELFNEKKLKEIFDRKKEEVLKISGVCLAIALTKELIPGKKEVISPKLYPQPFNLKEVFSPILKLFKKIKLPQIRLAWLSKLKIFKFKIPKLKLPKFPKLKLNKNLILILVLVFFLILGFVVAQIKEKQKLKNYQTTLEKIEEKVTRAESFLILKNRPELIQEANSLLRESWKELSPLVRKTKKMPLSLVNQILALKGEVGKNLFELNKLEIIENPELIFNFGQKEFRPQKMVAFGEKVYLFSPYSQNLFKINKNGQGELIKKVQKFHLGATMNDSILFFSKPNQLIILKKRKLFSATLSQPYLNFNFNNFSSFRKNLYFLDKKWGQIVKYPYKVNFKWGKPYLWLKKAVPAKGMAVDGSIWILEKGNSISRYYGGIFQEKLKLNIFPYPKHFTKIFTRFDLPYLYVLEPIQKRIAILSKKGKIIKQFQSEKFDNLLDFSVSKNGKIIWLLNGSKLYRIKFILSSEI